MVTFATLQTKVANWLIDTPPAVQAEVPALINYALLQLQEDHNFKIMEQELTFTTSVPNGGLGSPNPHLLGVVPYQTFKEYRGKPFWIKFDGTVRKMEVADKRGEIWGPDYFDDQDIGFPQVIVQGPPSDELGASNFYVYPLPDGNSDYSDGEYRIVIPIQKYLSVLVNGSDHNWFTDQPSGEQFIVNYAVAEGFARDWDEQRYSIWAARAEVYRKKIVLQDKRFRLSGVDTLVPHRLGARQSQLRI